MSRNSGVSRTLSALLLILAAVSSSMVFSIVMYMPTQTDLSIYNTGWNGLSRVFHDLDAHYLPSINIVMGSEAETIIFMPLKRLIGDEEFEGLRSYLEKGGVLAIFDEEGYSNDFLSWLGAGLKVSGVAVLDEISKYRSRFMPLARYTENSSLTVALNVPSYLEVGGGGAEPILITSPYAYADSDGDGYYTLGERRGSFTVGARLGVGNGTLYVFSDVSMLINEMYEFKGNKVFLSALVGGRRLYVDQSHIEAGLLDKLKYRLEVIATTELSRLSIILLLIATSMVVYYVYREH